MKDPATHFYLRYRRDGDGRALARLFDAVAPDLLDVARHLAPDVASAEDLVQATFVLAIEKAKRFDPSREVRPWLFGILAREAARARRKAGRQARERIDESRLLRDPIAADPLDEVEQSDTRAVVERALAELPPHYREVLAPYLSDGRSAPEIALALGGSRSAGHVRVQIGRGLELLRQRLPHSLALSGSAAVAVPRGEAALRAAILDHAKAHGLHTVGKLTAPLTLGLTAMGKIAWTAGIAALALVTVFVLRERTAPRANPEQGVPAATESASLLRAISPIAPNGVADRELIAPPFEARPVFPTHAKSPETIEFEAPTSKIPPPPHANLTLTVVQEDGQPIEAAEVRLWHNSQPAYGATPEVSRLGIPQLIYSDALGRAECATLTPGRTVVQVKAKGYSTRAPFETPWIAAEDSRALQLSLREEAILRGRVTDERGAALSGATVAVGEASATTDSDGAYELRGLDRKREAQLKASAPARPTLIEELDLAHGQVTTWNPVLEAPMVFAGRLTSPDGIGLEGWSLRAHFNREARLGVAEFDRTSYDRFHVWQTSTTTGASGIFTLEGIVGEEFVLSAQRGSAFDLNEHLVTFRDEIAGDQHAHLTIPHEPPCATVTGTFRFEDRQSPAGVWIRLSSEGLNAERSQKLDADGTFRFRVPVAGPARLVAEEHAEAVYAELEVELAAGETVQLNTWIGPSPGELEVRPALSDGRNRGFGIWLLKQIERLPGERSMFGFDSFHSVLRLPQGLYEVSSPEFSSLRAETVQVEVIAGQRVVAEPLVQPGMDADLRFVDESGNTIEGNVVVEVFHAATDTLLSSTHVNGERGCSMGLDTIPLILRATAADGRTGSVVFMGGPPSNGLPTRFVLR